MTTWIVGVGVLTVADQLHLPLLEFIRTLPIMRRSPILGQAGFLTISRCQDEVDVGSKFVETDRLDFPP